MRDFGDGIGGVAAFRQREFEREFRGSVMGVHQVIPWIMRQEHAGGPPSWWLSGVALDEGDFEQHEDGTISTHKHFHVQWKRDGLPAGPQTSHEQPSLSRRELLYWHYFLSSGGRHQQPPAVSKVIVRAGTTLDRLRRLSLALAENYQWDPAQATTFVLTGLVPYSQTWAERLPGALVRGRRPREISPKFSNLRSLPRSARASHWLSA